MFSLGSVTGRPGSSSALANPASASSWRAALPRGGGPPYPPAARSARPTHPGVPLVTSGVGPDLLGGLDDAGEFGPLLFLGEGVALLGGGEAALAGQAELVDVGVPGGL